MQTELLTYLKKHWFKASLVAIFIFVAFKKDLSFNINLNTPVRHEHGAPEPPAPVQSVKEEIRHETLTENVEQPVQTSTSSIIDRFKFPPLGEGRKIKANAYEELSSLAEDKIAAYIKRFTHVAVSEQDKYGIPASVILGNALLASQAGKREMSLKGNNHFALKCSSDWGGETGRYDAECFRHYENAWTSFRDHSLYLTTGEMGNRLSGLVGDQYKSWAQALEKAEFSKEKDYGQQLIRIIQDYQLYELDHK